MKLFPGRLSLETVDSTMEEAARRLRAGNPVGVISALDQTAGRGRRGKSWESVPGDSLLFTLTLDEPREPSAWLLGILAGVVVAETLDCSVRWPNDLVFETRKVGGILTEIVDDTILIGIGLNLNQSGFPSDLSFATSLRLETGHEHVAETLLADLVVRLTAETRPTHFSEIEARWIERDRTAGKRYRTVRGEEVEAIRVTANGELLARRADQELVINAAEALFG